MAKPYIPPTEEGMKGFEESVESEVAELIEHTVRHTSPRATAIGAAAVLRAAVTLYKASLQKVGDGLVDARSRAEQAQRQTGNPTVGPKTPGKVGALTRRANGIIDLTDGLTQQSVTLFHEVNGALTLAAEQTRALQPQNQQGDADL